MLRGGKHGAQESVGDRNGVCSSQQVHDEAEVMGQLQVEEADRAQDDTPRDAAREAGCARGNVGLAEGLAHYHQGDQGEHSIDPSTQLQAHECAAKAQCCKGGGGVVRQPPIQLRVEEEAHHPAVLAIHRDLQRRAQKQTNISHHNNTYNHHIVKITW